LARYYRIITGPLIFDSSQPGRENLLIEILQLLIITQSGVISGNPSKYCRSPNKYLTEIS
jgi:hypothetical protein